MALCDIRCQADTDRPDRPAGAQIGPRAGDATSPVRAALGPAAGSTPGSTGQTMQIDLLFSRMRAEYLLPPTVTQLTGPIFCKGESILEDSDAEGFVVLCVARSIFMATIMPCIKRTNCGNSLLCGL